MKEKKIIASVVLGVTLVTLISMLISMFADSLMLFTDANNFDGAKFSKDYVRALGNKNLVCFLLGIAFITIFFANKKYRVEVNLSSVIVLALYCIGTIVDARESVRLNYTNKLNVEEYSLFTSYLSSALTIAISSSLMVASEFYLMFIKKKELKTEEQVNSSKDTQVNS